MKPYNKYHLQQRVRINQPDSANASSACFRSTFHLSTYSSFLSFISLPAIPITNIGSDSTPTVAHPASEIHSNHFSETR